MAKHVKEIAELVNRISAADGWRVRPIARSGGWVAYPPDPKQSPVSIVAGPRNLYRHRRNTLALLRQRGLDLGAS